VNGEVPSERTPFRLREHQLFLVLSIVVGILAGLSAVLFSLAIDYTSRRLFGLEPSAARLFLVPPLVSIGTGMLLAWVFTGARGSGVPQTKAAYRLSGGDIPWQVPVGKFLTGVLCIGSGHSLGREGPSVQIGSGIASAIARWFRLSPSRVRELVPVGAAGALSAAFNTPVAAVIFALEEIIGDLNATLLGSTVVASVASVVVARSILGNEPLFHVPAYELVHPAELIVYALLGVLGGLVSLAFCKGLLAARGSFAKLPRWTRVWQPAMGGVVVGLVLLAVPQVMGVGYEHVDDALNGRLLFSTLALLGLVKLLATVTSYASGNAGGIFAPTLFIGAMAGGALGTLLQGTMPFPIGVPGAYALVGMGTLFAGIIRAPMTSVFMIFEITQDYQILVPLMIANLLSFVISRRYQPVPIYDALLRQDHVHLPDPAAHAARGGHVARDVMSTHAVMVAGEAAVGQARQETDGRAAPACLVGTRDAFLGTVSATRLDEAVAEGRGSDPVSSLVDGPLLHAHADHPLTVVIERLAQSDGILPIVGRRNVRELEGTVTLDDVTRFLRRRPQR